MTNARWEYCVCTVTLMLGGSTESAQGLMLGGSTESAL